MAHMQVRVNQPEKQTPTPVQPTPTMQPVTSTYQPPQSMQPAASPAASTYRQPPPVTGMDSHNRLHTDQYSISFDLNYLKTPIGIMSVLATVHAFVAIIVMAAQGHNWPLHNLSGAFGFYIFVAVLSFLVSAGAIFIGVTQFYKHYPTLPWPVVTVVSFAIMAFFTLLASCLVAARSVYPRDGACAVLGFLLFQAYVACFCLNLSEAVQYVNTSRQTQGARRPAHIHVETPPMGSPPSYMESCEPSSLPNSANLDNPTYG